MSKDAWLQNLQKGMLVRIIASQEKQLIGKLGTVKEVIKNSPRSRTRRAPGSDLLEIEVLVVFPDIINTNPATVMAKKGWTANQVGKAVEKAIDERYEKIFRPEHIAPASTMDRLLYG